MRSPALSPGLVGGAVGIDVTHLDARLGIIADRQDAEERLSVGGHGPFQHDLVHLDLVLAALDLERDDVALVLRPEALLKLGLVDDRLAVDGFDGIAGLEAAFLGGGTGGDGADGRGGVVHVRRLFHGDAEQAALERHGRFLGALEHTRQDGVDVFERNGEADAGVVPLEAGRLALRARRGRHQHALDPAVQVDERPAVIGRRHLGVGLNRLAPDAVEGADDADADRGQLVEPGRPGCGPRRWPSGRSAFRSWEPRPAPAACR